MPTVVISDQTLSSSTFVLLNEELAENVVLRDYGSLVVSSGGTANSIKVSNGGELVVSSCGTANSTTMSGGSLYLASGGIANSTTMSGGSLYLASGGTANATTMSGGWLYVSSGGTTNVTTVIQGSMYVGRGGIANSTMVSSGCLYVYSGGTANATMVNRGKLISSDGMYVSSGGTANATTVSSRGYLYVFSGGTALDIVENGGFVFVGQGAAVNFLPSVISAMVVSANVSMTVHSGTTANYTTMSGGSLTVFSGGTAYGTMVNSGGILYVHDGGTANSTTVNALGNMHVSSGGTVNSIWVNSGGSLFVSSGGTVNSTIVNSGGSLYLYEGGIANFTTVYENLYVSNGATVNSTFVNSGILYVYDGGTANATMVYHYEGSMHVSNGGIANSTTVSGNGDLFVYSGGTANATTVDSYGSMYVSNGGTANSTTVNYWGRLYVYSGGTANSTTVNNYGLLYVNSGGVANVTTMNGGMFMWVSSGGTVNSTTVNSARLTIESGATANSTIVNSGGGLHVYSGGTAMDIVENGGRVSVDEGAIVNFLPSVISGMVVSSGKGMTVHSGTTANSITVNSGTLYVYSGGTAMDIVENGGTVFVEEGATVNFLPCIVSGVVISSGISMTVHSGTTANSTTVSSVGVLCVSSGGTANATTVNSNAWLYVSDGGIANATTVSSRGTLCVSSGGTANVTTVSSRGTLCVSNGGTANVTTVNSSGWLIVSSGGTANSTMVSSGGTVVFSSAGVHSGTMQIASGAVVSAYAGAKIDFTVAGSTNPSVALIDHYDYISGASNAVYTITVDDNQASGQYVLADYAQSFNSTVTVKTALGEELGSISLENRLINEGTNYRLTRNAAGTLLLDVSFDDTPPTITNIGADVTSPTNGSVTVSATFADETELAQSLYRIGEGDWLDYTGPVTVTENGTVYFKAKDTSDNEATAQYTVSNIDKVVPVITLTGDNETPLQAATLSAAVSEDADIYYSTDNETWTMYAGPLDITANGSWYFKATDAAGNTGYAQISFANIDTVEPVIELVGDNAIPLHASTLTASTEDGVDIYYSTDNESWTMYTGQLDISANGTWYFKATDAAGNMGTAQITFGNICAAQGEDPSVEPGTTEPTNGSVVVQKEFGEDVVTEQYSTDGGETWQDYPEDGVVMEDNGTVLFRGLDEQGNVVDASSYEVTNIDKVAPDAPASPVADVTGPTSGDVTVTAEFSDDSVVKEYRIGDEGEWLPYPEDGVVVTENGTVYFRGKDAAGNISDISSVVVSNIDKIEPVITLTGDNEMPLQAATLTAAVSEDADIYYSNDNETWTMYTGQLDITANGTWYFKATDAAGNIGTAQITFGNICAAQGEDPSVEPGTTEPTNGSVVVRKEFGEDVVTGQYSTDGGETWQDYPEDGVVMEDNGTVLFRGLDEQGNVVDASSYEVTNIDKVAPDAPASPVADVTGPTSGDVTVTAEFSDDSVVKEYRIGDEGEWLPYPEDGVVVTENGTVYFRGTDAVGNVSDTTSVVVSNIDKTAPVITLVGDNETPLQATTLSASTEEGVTIYYSIDNKFWGEYEGEIPVSANGTWYFKATDAVGNTGYAQITFANIDTEEPVITLTGDNETPLQATTLTAAVNEDVDIFYSTDNESWTLYTDQLDITENGTWYFKATDAAGNEGTAEITFGNIDAVAPEAPVATADITEPTNGMVTVTAVFSDDSVLRQYRIGDGDWQDYVSGVGLYENGTVWFRGGDAAGNWSEEVSCTVANIDTTLPDSPTVTADITDITWRPVSLLAEFPEDAVSREWRLDDGDWNEYTGAVVLGENGLAEFRATDEAGNASVAQYNVTNIVTPQEFVYREFAGDIGFNGNYQDNFELDVALPGYFTLAGDFGALNGSIDIMNSKKKVATGTVKKGVLTFNKGKTALLDAGYYTIVVKNSDKGKSASQYTFALEGQTLFTKGDNSNDWGDLKTKGAEGAVGSLGAFTAQTKAVVADWVGFGDAIDYMAFTLDSAASLVFDVASTDAVKFAVYSLQPKTSKDTTTYSLKSIATVTPKANKAKTQYASSSKALLLEKGTYYISVQSTNAAKGGNADYTVELSDNSRFYTKGDNSDDWTNMKAVGAEGLKATLGAVTAESGMLRNDGWVGFGDAIDYASFTLDSAASLAFDVTATDATKFTIYQLQEKKDSKNNVTYSLKSLQSNTLKANKDKTQYTIATKNLLLEAGTYYVAMENTTAKKGGYADYTIANSENSSFFTKGNNADDKWDAENLPAFCGQWEDWTGYGDAIDYRRLDLATPTRLALDLTATDATKFTVWQLDTKTNKLKSLQATTLSANKTKTQYTASTKELFLNAGTYYISMECTTAKKGGDADFTVAYGDKYQTFENCDNSNDTWQDASVKDVVALGDALAGWVGFGDTSDFYKFEVAEQGKLSIVLDDDTSAALTGKEIKFSCLDDKGKNVALAAFKGGTLDSSKELAAGTYYLGITCANVQKYDTSYNVSIGMLA